MMAETSIGLLISLFSRRLIPRNPRCYIYSPEKPVLSMGSSCMECALKNANSLILSVVMLVTSISTATSAQTRVESIATALNHFSVIELPRIRRFKTWQLALVLRMFWFSLKVGMCS